MQNRDIARKLRETADLMEVAGEDAFRVRSYRRAADVIDGCPEPLLGMRDEPKRILALPGIGKTMRDHVLELLATGDLHLHRELLARFRPGMLQLLQVSGLGPKTVALIWQTYQAGTLDEVEALAKAGKLRSLPRLGTKAEEKILRGIAVLRELSGRYRRDQAVEALDVLLPYLQQVPGVERLQVAGSFRRGKETVGDLDLLAAGHGYPSAGAPLAEALATAPRVEEVLARGENKVSVRLQGSSMQVDLRLLPPESFGAALQYFTGSQQHNIQLRARAQQRGLRLNEYALTQEATGIVVASAREEEIYAALDLPWIPPELREGTGELDTVPLPRLLQVEDLRGDVHMHTTASDGRASIEEMAAAASERGYSYIAITDHSQALAMANGLDERRMLAHIRQIRAAEAEFQRSHPDFRILAGIEVDILADGRLDMADEVLEQLDVVIGSIHSRFDQSEADTTTRLLAAIGNPNLDILGHPSGRLLLRREAYKYDFEQVLAACAAAGVAMEINSSPERLDVNDLQARRCGQVGVRVVINTDAHHPRHLANISYGVSVARRGWLEPRHVLNTRPAAEFLAGLRAQR